MSKRTCDIRESILISTKIVLKSEGYDEVSIRRVARDSNTAVGTIYNYFKSKDELVANVILSDWKEVLAGIESTIADTKDLKSGLISLYRALHEFNYSYRNVWKQYMNTPASACCILKNHDVLRDQVSEKVSLLLKAAGKEELLPASPLISEMLLAMATRQGIDDAALECLCDQLLK